MTNDKIYASQQLICMLPPLALKVLCYLINWQKYENIKYYEGQMTKFMHISKTELEIGIQTLVDNKLVDVCSIDGNWVLTLNRDTIKKYFNVKMDDVKNHEGLKLSSEITWNKVENNDDSFAEMSDEQLTKMIQELQRRREKKREFQTVYATNMDVTDDLPW